MNIRTAVLALLLTVLACSTSVRVAPLNTAKFPEECGCWFWRAGDPQKAHVLEENTDASELWINIDGKDTKVTLLSERELEDGRVLQKYAFGDGRMLDLTIRDLGKDYLEADWGRVDGVLILHEGEHSQRIDLEGGCGC